MFERNKIDNSTPSQQVSVPAEVEFDTGEIARGKFHISVNRSFADTINADSPFLEFEPYGEARRFIAKSMIRSVKQVAVPGAINLNSRVRDADGFEPHRVLGVTSKTEWAEVRAAYVALSKTYHPDRYVSVDLPDEVRDYLSSMSRRINLAYAALEQPRQTQKKVAERPAPVYESRPRA